MKWTNFIFKKSLSFIAFCLLQQTARADLIPYFDNLGCEKKTTSLAPFYATSVTGEKWETFNFISPQLRKVYGPSEHITTEKFRNQQKVANQRVSRNTLVKINHDFYITNKDSSMILDTILNSDVAINKYIPVKVLTPETIYSRMKADKEQLLFVKPGDQGLVLSESLNAIDDQSVLIANTNILLDSGLTLAKGSLLYPIHSKNEKGSKFYEYYYCRDSKKLLYPFILQSPGQNQKNSDQVIYLNIRVDGPQLSPLKTEDVESLRKVQRTFRKIYSQDINLADLEVDYKGFIRMPMTQETDTTKISSYSYDNNFVHYQGGDPLTSDTWGTANTLCAMMKLAAKWKNTCVGNGCLLQMGDISFATGASNYRNRNRDALGHVSHFTGKCIDLRPIRKDNLLTGATVRDPKYDRKKTTQFIEFAQDKGADVVIFGDRKVTKTMDDVILDAEHRDHVHICFPEESVKNYCD